MTVQDLIDALKTYPPEMPVVIMDASHDEPGAEPEFVVKKMHHEDTVAPIRTLQIWSK